MEKHQDLVLELHPNSEIELVQINDAYALRNKRNGLYYPNEKEDIGDAKYFAEVRNYSYESKTFVAKSYGENFWVILDERGQQLSSDQYAFIGEENNGYRIVKSAKIYKDKHGNDRYHWSIIGSNNRKVLPFIKNSGRSELGLYPGSELLGELFNNPLSECPQWVIRNHNESEEGTDYYTICDPRRSDWFQNKYKTIPEILDWENRIFCCHTIDGKVHVMQCRDKIIASRINGKASVTCAQCVTLGSGQKGILLQYKTGYDAIYIIGSNRFIDLPNNVKPNQVFIGGDIAIIKANSTYLGIIDYEVFIVAGKKYEKFYLNGRIETFVPAENRVIIHCRNGESVETSIADVVNYPFNLNEYVESCRHAVINDFVEKENTPGSVAVKVQDSVTSQIKTPQLSPEIKVNISLLIKCNDCRFRGDKVHVKKTSLKSFIVSKGSNCILLVLDFKNQKVMIVQPNITSLENKLYIPLHVQAMSETILGYRNRHEIKEICDISCTIAELEDKIVSVLTTRIERQQEIDIRATIDNLKEQPEEIVNSVIEAEISPETFSYRVNKISEEYDELYNQYSRLLENDDSEQSLIDFINNQMPLKTKEKENFRIVMDYYHKWHGQTFDYALQSTCNEINSTCDEINYGNVILQEYNDIKDKRANNLKRHEERLRQLIMAKIASSKVNENSVSPETVRFSEIQSNSSDTPIWVETGPNSLPKPSNRFTLNECYRSDEAHPGRKVLNRGNNRNGAHFIISPKEAEKLVCQNSSIYELEGQSDWISENNFNGLVASNSRPLYIFIRNQTGDKYIFFDEACCIAYRLAEEGSRKFVLFQLKSLLKFRE